MRALLVDRSEICRNGFKLALQGRFDACDICEASSIDEALECMEDHGVDIVLLTLDQRIDMKDPKVILLQENAGKTPVLVVGDAVNKSYVNEMLHHNVKGFLDRSATQEVPIAAIQLVLAGGHYFPPEAHESQQTQMRSANEPSVKFAEGIGRILTPRQIEVLRAISEGKSNKAIADELGISPGTVKVHVSNLMKDLHAKNRTQAVSIANNLHLLKH